MLPPGQSGDLLFPSTASDQLRLYDWLTPRFRNVRRSDLTRYFMPARSGVTPPDLPQVISFNGYRLR